MDKFGDFLKAHRENKGIRLEEIASITKIHIHALQQLEAGDWDKLPPEPFLRGFIVAYTKYVGIETEDALSRYQAERHGMGPDGSPKPHSQAPMPAPPEERVARKKGSANEVISESTALPLGKIAGAGIGVVISAIIVGLIYVGRQSGDELAKTAEPEPDAQVTAAAGEGDESPFVDLDLNKEENAQTTQAKASDSAAPASDAKPEQALDSDSVERQAATTEEGNVAHKLVVRGSERTWMKVIVDDNKPLEYFLRKGKTAGYAAKEKIKVIIGDINNTEVFYNNEAAEGKKLRGNVVVFTYPSDATFPQDVIQKEPASSDNEEQDEE